MPRGKRTRIATGVYQDSIGFSVIVRHVETRYPPSKSLPWLKVERERRIYDLTAKAKRSAPGTLRADVLAYLKTLPAGRMKQDRELELAPWVTAYGDLPRSVLTAQMVAQQLAQWPKAASTLNHRRQALKAVYKALDGRHAPTPCDDVAKQIERREVRGVPRAVVLAILRQLRPCATTARLKLLARTGWPHAQIARLQPHDIDFAARVVRVPARRKGAGTKPRTIPITYTAARALRLMEHHDAWGDFSRHSMHKTFRLAVKKAKDKWKGPWPAPANLRPYDLRHAFITEVYRRTKDLRATAELALHADLSTTARYADSAVTATAQAARDAMDRGVRKVALSKKPKKRQR